ncbi:MAG: TfoX/Sxy family protein [Planktotalea sp.]|uniref:TfoX/Sxy family protein n=1 Tax=Planktotalea sp. TaxID=2029877 RepID=UPI003C7708E5
MAYDEGLAEVMRDDLAQLEGLKEVRMFGGICFMHHGHMLCGVHKDGALYRVGKERHSMALDLAGVHEMTMTGRSMGGLVDVEINAMAEDALRERLLEMSLEFTASLPPK